MYDKKKDGLKPVAFRGRYYKRVNNSNHQLSAIEITNLSLQSLQLSWDSYPAHGKRLEDLDPRKVTVFIEKVNAIIHRDYMSTIDIQIKIFTNHILFFNPGSLPDSITIEQLLANTYVSTPRNRQIAKMVKEMGMIERYGTGIKRVRKMFTDYGLPEPRFETPPGGFAVTVFANAENEEDINKVGVNVGVNAVLMLIEKNPGINVLTMTKNFNVSQRTIERWINQLKKENKIEFKGASKSGGYYAINTKDGNYDNN
jgi:predicted HTH transcriptional regulator